MANQTVQGPYRVKNIGVNGNVYEVVEMLSDTENQYAELRPRRTYLKRQSAYAKMVRLNRRWQEDHALDEI